MEKKLAILEKMDREGVGFGFNEYSNEELKLYEDKDYSKLIDLNLERALNALEHAYDKAYERLKHNFDDPQGNELMGEVQHFLSNNLKAKYAYQVTLKGNPQKKYLQNKIESLSVLENYNLKYLDSIHDSRIFIEADLIKNELLDYKEYKIISDGDGFKNKVGNDVNYIHLCKSSLENINVLFLLCINQSKTKFSDFYKAGKANRILNNYDLSFLCLKYHLQRNCNDLETMYELGLLFNSLNQFEYSLNYFKQISILNPDFKHSLEILKRTAKACYRHEELVSLFDYINNNDLSKSPKLRELTVPNTNFGWFSILPLRKKRPSILVSSIPKSGSTYLWRLIKRVVNFPDIKFFIQYSEGYNFNVAPIPSSINTFSKGGFICRQHFNTNNNVIDILKDHGINKVIVHVRDPRQTIISRLFYEEAMLRKKSLDPQLKLILPQDYAVQPFEQKVDFYIDNLLPHIIQYMEDWQQTYKNADINILFTKYEDLIDNKEKVLMQILDFYGLKKSYSSISLKDGEITKMRSGKTDEWKELLTSEQKVFANSLMSNSLKDFYGYY